MTTVYVLIGVVGGVYIIENACYLTRKQSLFYFIMALKGRLISGQDRPLDRLRLCRCAKDLDLLYAELLHK